MCVGSRLGVSVWRMIPLLLCGLGCLLKTLWMPPCLRTLLLPGQVKCWNAPTFHTWRYRFSRFLTLNVLNLLNVCNLRHVMLYSGTKYHENSHPGTLHTVSQVIICRGTGCSSGCVVPRCLINYIPWEKTPGCFLFLPMPGLMVLFSNASASQ